MHWGGITEIAGSPSLLLEYLHQLNYDKIYKSGRVLEQRKPPGAECLRKPPNG